MKHLTTEQFKQIYKAATELAELESGCRIREEKRESTKIELCKRYAKECKRLPKKYTIVFTETENITNSRRWSHYIKAIHQYEVGDNSTTRETEKSIIIERKDGDPHYKKIINKEKILCYVW